METRPGMGDSSEERAAMLTVQGGVRKAAISSLQAPSLQANGTHGRLRANPGYPAYPFPVPHMTRKLIALAALLLAGQAQAANWQPGKHYTVLPQAQRTNVPAGKVEVLEVFSYGCPACDQFVPAMKRIKAALPPNAQLAYLHASWNKAEAWPMFQRAFVTAQSLGISEKAHEEMFKAIWHTGELGLVEPGSRRLKKTLPTINDAAKFYERVTGVKAADFVNASKSFGVDMKVRQADAQILAMKVTGTPTLVVNGKYVLNSEHLTSLEEIIELVNFLVTRETKPAAAPAAAPVKKT
jgi:thiol:disulfide interchange protein DsbA